jgi:signal peptidase I
MLALGLVAVLALCTVDGSLRRLVEPAGSSSDDDPSPDAGDGPDGDGDGVGDGREARVDPAPHVPSDATTVVSRRTLRRSARRTRRSRRLGGAAVVLVLAGGAGVLLPSEAVAAPWSRTTSTSTSFAALTVPPATALTCTANGDGSVNIGFAYGGPTATSFSVMSGTTVLATGATSPVRVTGSGLLNLGQVYTVTVRVDYLGNWTSTSTATTRVQTALVGTTLSCA